MSPFNDAAAIHLQKQGLDEKRALECSTQSVSIRHQQIRRKVLGLDAKKLQIVTPIASEATPISFFDTGVFGKEKPSPNSAARTSPIAITQILTKSAKDAKNLLAVVADQGLFTLFGHAIAQVFVDVMSIQSKFVPDTERKNSYTGLTPVFQQCLDLSLDCAMSVGVKGTMVKGSTYRVASGLIYVAEALLFYMVEVLNLVVFTVTISSQLVAFINRIARSVQAARDLHAVLELPTDTSETQVFLRSIPTVFHDIDFPYPSRPDVPSIATGETVALVSASSCGKSTIARVLQRLCESSSGFVEVADIDTGAMNIQQLCQCVSIISQPADLFDASVAENIGYGKSLISEVDIRKAIKTADIHDQVMSLEKDWTRTSARTLASFRVDEHKDCKLPGRLLDRVGFEWLKQALRHRAGYYHTRS
ncbi:uncharacterized protein C8R40DRAFT_1066984 [Lentinula edodes]|uniref:uncharacterized protein n=1 Tax=Lentinula edodes TaxID=5353 RepID=UPI001E8D2201|nr:uncharacterized protein C8R40DRAFT_1066984 [Lentinula edodes]KAH7878546.1 hypothetical protein C8R40DRAFT_1066984 [Lentinula edodes]